MKRFLLSLAVLSFSAILTLTTINCDGGGGSDNDDSVQRLIFYTSTRGAADFSSWSDISGLGLSGVDAADGICQARAAAAGLPGTFAAWLSDDTDDAYCRAHGLTGKKAGNCGQAELPASAGPWFRTDGEPFSAGIEDLVNSGVVYYPAQANEFGSVFPLNYRYFTGTDVNGVAYTDNCSNWTDSTSSGVNITLGGTFTTTGRWTEGFGNTSCAGDQSLLCLEIGTNNSVPAPDDPGKIVFLSSANGNGNLGSWALAGGETGLLAADNICRESASVAGLPNPSTYVAWLSTSGTNAIERLSTDGPWVRIDGIQVAASKSALVNSWLETSISVTENGVHTWTGVWTGTMEAGTKAAELCSDWTSGSTANAGRYGDSAHADDSSWTQSSTSQCSQVVRRLYCFED